MTLIVGAGLAGTRLALALDAFWTRTREREPLVVFSEHGPFDRMALGEWALGQHPWPALETASREETRFLQRSIVRLDRETRTATDSLGENWVWDRLVFATGTEPIVPDCFVDHADAVAIASVDGAAALQRRLTSTSRLLVVGGGPLGLETAWNLRRRGHEVTLAHRGARLLEPFLDEEGSAHIAARWRAEGIELKTNSSEIALVEGSQREVTFGDGSRWSGDLVVLTCGTRPRTELARQAGLAVTEQGVVVDVEGRTSCPSVWAVGDCTVARTGTTAGLWAPARRSVDRLVAAWTEARVADDAKESPFRLKVEWPVVAWGNPIASGNEVQVTQSESSWKATGDPPDLRFWQVLGPWDALEARVAELSAGIVRLVPADPSPAGWPADHVVCDCHGIDTGTLRQAWRRANDLRTLGEMTGAGTSCGSCRARLLALKQGRLSARERWSKTYRQTRWGRWSWADVVGYAINFGMLVSGLLTVLTGLLKMPGWMEALGIDQRSLPDEANMALSALLDLHDWPGVILTVLALLHVTLHARMMVDFVASWFRKRGS